NINSISSQQAALDNALVPPEKRLKIKRCNARITFSKPQREEMYQVTLEALKLSPFYPAFQITAEVLEIYMHQFWTTIKKIGNLDGYNFKLERRNEELVTFIQELGYSGRCNMLSIIYTDQMHQSWRTFVVIFNSSQQRNKFSKERAQPYPRFTKVIINHFISKDKTIFMRNKIKLHTIHDDSLLGTLKFFSKTQDYQQYGALNPNDMINQDVKDSQAYKTYYDFATRKVPPKKARRCNMLSTIHTDQMHQSWRTFVVIFNRCIFRKTTGLDRLKESRAQILWGMYNKKNVDYVVLHWKNSCIKLTTEK
nr:hypothetical protein [Tanacetum cinerariifolium]